MTGLLIALVGPSGAGKDSLISGARRHFGRFAGIGFVRRIITRDPDLNEDHEPVTPERFRQLEASGGFALTWRANGLSYGLPASILADLADGKVLVANVSRDAIARLKETFPRVLIVHVTASADILGERLARRSRETEDDQRARLARALLLDLAVEADIRIENNGTLASAEQRFIALLEAFVATPLSRRTMP